MRYSWSKVFTNFPIIASIFSALKSTISYKPSISIHWALLISRSRQQIFSVLGRCAKYSAVVCKSEPFRYYHDIIINWNWKFLVVLFLLTYNNVWALKTKLCSRCSTKTSAWEGSISVYAFSYVTWLCEGCKLSKSKWDKMQVLVWLLPLKPVEENNTKQIHIVNIFCPATVVANCGNPFQISCASVQTDDI